jgi:EAL domain-containing protein (putative c-di-GMP-specific phosphodiesterase class I)
LYYQPQINCSSNEINGLEALIRWNHPEFGLIHPSKFIPIADQISFIDTIGEWVIRTACKQNREWQRSGLPKIPVSVNLSLQQFQNPYIVEQIQNILLETDLDPNYLELEIKENVIMYETEEIAQTLLLLRNEGITITIDDFSVKYPSLDYLKQISVDKIKIESPFVESIDYSRIEEANIKNIIEQAKQMGLRVLAKGVETEAQLSFLRQQKCDEIQGDLYYAAMPAELVKKLLKITYSQDELMII